MTSGRFRGALPWKPRFHPCGFPGAASSHSEFSSWGQGAVQGRPRPQRARQAFLSLGLDLPFCASHSCVAWAVAPPAAAPPERGTPTPTLARVCPVGLQHLLGVGFS